MSINGALIGTKRLYADGKFSKPDGRAVFAVAPWRGLQAAGKQQEKDKFPFLINNGRANHVWQSAYLDQILAAGFDGAFLDVVDAYDYFSAASAE